MDIGVDQDATQSEDQSGVQETLLGGREFRGAVEHREPGAPELKPAPEGVPEKFWDPIKGELRSDDLIRSYAELEKKIGAPKEAAQEAAEAAEGSDEGEGQEGSEEGSEGAQEGAEGEQEGDNEGDGEGEGDNDGDDSSDSGDLAASVAAAQDVYAQTGELPASAREPLIKAGITNEQIDFYLAGVKATEAALQGAAEKAAGSAEDLAAAIEWAGKAWVKTPKKALAFNAQMGDVETVAPAVAGLMAEYRAANPGEGRLHNTNTGITYGDVYTDMDEFTQDLDRADQARDKVARKKAIQKLARSRQAGTVKSERRSPFGG